jgi:hypothetical protein
MYFRWIIQMNHRFLGKFLCIFVSLSVTYKPFSVNNNNRTG